MKQKGFTLIFHLIIIVFFGIAVIGYFAYKKGEVKIPFLIPAKYAKLGETCGGGWDPNPPLCTKGLVCYTNPNVMLSDVPGTCQYPTPTNLQKTDIKIYYYDENIETDPEFDCSANTFRTIEIQTNEENKIKDSIEALIKKAVFEQNVNFELLGSNLENGTLTLEFTDVPGFTTGGSCRIILMMDQITKTAKQFPEVKKVRFDPEVFQP